ncbi:MAG TPA: hypothetical protein VFP61_08170 [Acidimicrobiales bacterium]|nr:hypothetical protein [Acidimicrobiales bacterium]
MTTEPSKGGPPEASFRRLDDLAALVQDNVVIVLHDVERTTQLRPVVTVDAYDGVVRIAYGDNFKTPSVHAHTKPAPLAETADYLQDHVVEDLWAAWPVCSTHDKGAYAEVHDGAAVRWCRFGGHVVARVGALGK